MKSLLFFLSLFFSIQALAVQEIKMIVPFSPGGSNDQLSKVLANRLSSSKYKFVIDYKLGAGGSVAANYVATTKNETLLMITSNGLIANPMINLTERYNVQRDFVFVSYLGAEPLLLAVPSASSVMNFADFVAAGQTRNMPYGSGGIGTSSHIISAIIANNNPNFIHIPYKGGSAVMIDLIAGRVNWVTESASVLDPFIQDNRVRPIAVFNRARLPQYPGVPTTRELGINDRDFFRWHIMVANTAADPAVLSYVKSRLREPDIQAAIRDLGIDTTPVRNTDTFFNTETVKLHRIIRDFNIKQ